MEPGKPETAEAGKQKEEVELPNEGEPSTGPAEVIKKETADTTSKHKAKCSKGQKDEQRKSKKNKR